MLSLCARVEGVQRVSHDEINNALEQFVAAREEVCDSILERGYDYDIEHLSPELKLRSIGKSAQKIHRYLVDHPKSSRAEIREAFPRIQDTVFNRSMDEMMRSNLIYRTSSTDDCYSAV